MTACGCVRDRCSRNRAAPTRRSPGSRSRSAALTQDGAQRLRNVAVEHDVERLPTLDRGGEAMADALGESQNALVGWRAPPAQRERHLALALDEIEGGEMRADRLGELIRIDTLLADIGRLENLQIASRQ